MVARKIQDETELRRWYESGLTYQQMADRYLEKYNLEVSPTLFSSWRKRIGLPKRIVRDDSLIPWEVKAEHRGNYDLVMLRLEARARAGARLSDMEDRRLDGWRRGLNETAAVIYYDPDTEDGFFRIPREEQDDDYIRRPEQPTTKMRNVRPEPRQYHVE